MARLEIPPCAVCAEPVIPSVVANARAAGELLAAARFEVRGGEGAWSLHLCADHRPELLEIAHRGQWRKRRHSDTDEFWWGDPPPRSATGLGRMHRLL